MLFALRRWSSRSRTSSSRSITTACLLLDRTDVVDWLTGTKGLELLKPAPETALKVWPVSRRVNSSKAPDEPTLIEPIELPPAQSP